MLHKTLIFAGLLCAIAMPCHAQTSVEANAAQPHAPCALHIWPAATTHTTFQGWWKAGAVDGARRGIKGYPDLRADAIDSEQQALILKQIDWRAIHHDPELEVVVHQAPTGSEDDRGRTSRLVSNGSACYREIVVTSSLVEAATFSTRSVRILALRKTFEGDAAPVNFSSMAKAVITLPEQIQAGDPLIDEATRKAFAEAIGKFAVMQSFH